MDDMESIRRRTRAFDPVNYLETPEDMAAHLQAAFMDGDSRIIAAALGNIARARGMAQLAQETGLTRESLYVSLSEKGNPRLDTLMKVVSALGIDLMAVPGRSPRALKATAGEEGLSPAKKKSSARSTGKKAAPLKAAAKRVPAK